MGRPDSPTPPTTNRTHVRLTRWTKLSNSLLHRPPYRPQWGYRRIHGEPATMGVVIAASSVWASLKRHRVDPSPRRLGPTWAEFLATQAKGLMACDLFHVDTILLRGLYVLVFIHHDTRLVRIAGIKTNPATARVTQQARNFTSHLQYTRRRFGIEFLDPSGQEVGAVDPESQGEPVLATVRGEQTQPVLPAHLCDQRVVDVAAEVQFASSAEHDEKRSRRGRQDALAVFPPVCQQPGTEVGRLSEGAAQL